MNFDVCAHCKLGEWREVKPDEHYICGYHEFICSPFKTMRNCFYLQVYKELYDEIKRVSEYKKVRRDDYNFLKFKDSSKLLKEALQPVPIEEDCPHYIDHILSEWNEK